jgi:flagellar hook-associated protein 2
MATDAISALGAGSGVDVKSLATSLVDAERVPKKEAINNKITKAEKGVSGYAAIKFVLDGMKSSFLNLKDQSDYNSVTPRISQPSSVAVTATTASGSHSINVINLATAQRRVSAGFPAGNTPLNGGQAFNLSLSVHGSSPAESINIPAGFDTPGGIVAYINSANKGISANLVNTGEATNPFKIMLTGQTGANSDFTLSSPIAGLGFATPIQSSSFASKSTSVSANSFNLSLSVNGGAAQNISVSGNSDLTGVSNAINAANLGLSAEVINTGDPQKPFKLMVKGGNLDFSLTAPVEGLSFSSSLQQASNATVNVNGLNLTPSSNKLEGLIPGATIELLAPTSGNASIDFNRDVSGVKTKLQDLVTAYNDANSMLTVVSDPKSKVETYGATLVGNSVVNTVRNKMREMVLADSNSPSGGITALRDLGISLDRNGVMTLDNTKLDSVLSSKFDHVVTMLSANRENMSVFNASTAGVAGEAVKKLTTLLDKTGSLTVQSENLTTRITEYKKDLTKLEERMTQLLARYNKQFANMESIVGQSKSLRTSLTSTFEGMMASYTNK